MSSVLLVPVSATVAVVTVVVLGLTKVILKHLQRLKRCNIFKCVCEYESDVDEPEEKKEDDDPDKIRCPVFSD